VDGLSRRGPRTHKTFNFLRVSFDFAAFGLRGTAIAIGLIRMENRINYSVGSMAEAIEPSDWLSAHGDYLFNLAVGQVRDPLVAEDLVQETFLAAIKARERFSGRSSDRTWLVGILRHKIYDHLRRVCRERAVHTEHSTTRSNQETWDDSLLWAHDVAAECMEPSRRLELAEFREALEMALGKLPERIAQVFQLYEVEERPNCEVCARLNISESNLWVMLHRARKQLQRELGDWWHGATGLRASVARGNSGPAVIADKTQPSPVLN
jgi:RNA polymerase sigma-70 factor (ECF subfamily)